MNDFKEWLSDYLRYFMLAAALLLIFGMIIIGTNIYRGMRQTDDQDVIQILTETENVTEAETEIQTEIQTENMTEIQTELYSETYQDTEMPSDTELHTANQTESESDIESETDSEAETEIQTETETEYVPVYKTLIGSCYIRSAPSMEAEILGEYIYGTTVEFLEDVGGWYKVQIDGMTGYMGARFFND